MALKITYVPADDLKISKQNARTHSKKQIELIAKSIKEFGWTNPILTDGKGGVVAGAGRLEAARKLGEKKVPTIELASLTPKQRRAYMIADNKIAAMSGWDDDILGGELMALLDDGFDMSLTGFDQDELDALLAGDEVEVKEGNLSKVDAVLKEPENKVEQGQTWKLGPHTMHCMSVVDDWSKWFPSLKDGNLLCVYPGPFVVVSKKAKDHVLVMVQPDPYVAGHILDTFQRIAKTKPKKVA